EGGAPMGNEPLTREEVEQVADLVCRDKSVGDEAVALRGRLGFTSWVVLDMEALRFFVAWSRVRPTPPAPPAPHPDGAQRFLEFAAKLGPLPTSAMASG